MNHRLVFFLLAALVLCGIGVFLVLQAGDRPGQSAAPIAAARQEDRRGNPTAGGASEGKGLSPKSGNRRARDATPHPVVTASGLQYEVLREGDGPRPGPTDRVQVHYRGTTADGEEFDSSYDRGPATFPLNGVIKGWGEGVQLMKIGSKFRFVIPSELAYGKAGYPGKIGPHATLTFEIELLGIEEPVAQ